MSLKNKVLNGELVIEIESYLDACKLEDFFNVDLTDKFYIYFEDGKLSENQNLFFSNKKIIESTEFIKELNIDE